MNNSAAQSRSKQLSIKPRMSLGEITAYAAHLQRASVVLEFGMGGSTCLAAAQHVEHLYSVEADQGWIDRCLAMPEVTPLVRAGRLVTHRPDIGPIAAYSMPMDPASANRWPNYSTSVWDQLAHTPDLVLIDGRFRVSCFLQAIMRLPASTTYVIHDFWSREHYRPMLQFASLVDRVDDLAILRAHHDIDWRSVGLATSAYLLDPR